MTKYSSVCDGAGSSDLSHHDVRVILNVGGQRHETFLSTLENFPDTRLAWISEQLRKTPHRDHEFFFDRHPGLFAHILNYFRTGKLHVPRDICGPMFEEELAYWGIDAMEIEHCCWAYYDEHNELEKTWGQLMSAVAPQSDRDESELLSGDDMSREDDGAADNGLTTFKKKWRGVRKKIWRILEDPYSSRLAWIFNILSVVLSVLALLLFCLSSLPDFLNKSTEEYKITFGLETFVITVFSTEMILRLVTAPKIRKLLTEKSIWVDLFSILPFFITLAFPSYQSLRILKVMYVLRLYKAFEAFRFSYVLQVFIQTINGSIKELLLLLFICSILVISFGALAYYAERQENTDGFANIPASFWWSLITMTTVGYGDVSPNTVGGKIVGCACAISGVLLLALPTSIVTTNFSLYNAYAKAKMKLPPRKKTRVVNNALKNVHLRSRDGLASSSPMPNYGSEQRLNGLHGSPASPQKLRRQTRSPVILGLNPVGQALYDTRRRSSIT